jgi:hypothetical protein
VARFLRRMKGILFSSAENAHGFDISGAVATRLHWLIVGSCVSASKAEQVDGNLRPLEAGEIAVEAFIFGLPLVMSYGIMYEASIDRTSGQFKAPINQVKNESRVFTYKDTSAPLPNRDTPYSILFADLRAEPIIMSVPNVEKGRYYSVMLSDFSTYNYG